MKIKRILYDKSLYFYREQRQVIYSVWDNDETYVPAGNMLGKDFVAGFICPIFFLTRSPCRIVTTSATKDHLRVLWGEINNFITMGTSTGLKVPLTSDKGGPLLVNFREIKKFVKGEVEKKSYIIGMVAGPESTAAMQGHHVPDIGDGIPRNLAVVDEASSVRNVYMDMITTWAKRIFVIGNTWPCENFFKHAIKGRPGTEDKGGDIPRPGGRGGYYRKVIKIRAVDHPNIRFALNEIRAGKAPSNKVLVPGKTWQEYEKNLKMMNKHQQCVSLGADFYDGAEIKLYPKEWLDRAHALYRSRPRLRTLPRFMGIDPAEGGDKTTWCIVDSLGIIDLISIQTPDTDTIIGQTLALMTMHKIPGHHVRFDRGGGGKQHADRLRKRGHKVKTVGFGAQPTLEVKRGVHTFDERVDSQEDRTAFKNMRAEMADDIRELIKPDAEGFSIPDMGEQYAELRNQLSVIPLQYDSEGKMYLPPKNKSKPGSKEVTLVDLIGHSPDEFDALCLAVHSLLSKARQITAGPG